MIVTVGVGILAVLLGAYQVIGLQDEIVSSGSVRGGLQSVFDIPPYVLLLCVILVPAFALVGIWRFMK